MSTSKRLSLTKRLNQKRCDADKTVLQRNSVTITELFNVQQSSASSASRRRDVSSNTVVNANNKVSRLSLKKARGDSYNLEECSSTSLSSLQEEMSFADITCSSELCLSVVDMFGVKQETETLSVPVTNSDSHLLDKSECLKNTVRSISDSNSIGTESNRLKDNESDENINVVAVPYMPYYLESFLLVIDTILNDSFYGDLISDDDLVPVGIFRSLSEDAQKLYVRLFLRKHRWIRAEKVVYKDIASDLSRILSDISECNLVLDESRLESVEEVVNCLPAPSLKSLAKTLQINCSSVKKQDLSSAIIKHSKQRNVSSFFGGRSNATENMVLKRAKALLGRCYRLDAKSRSVFTRMMMLFGLHNSVSEDQSSGQQQVFQMLMTRIGRVKYPQYTVQRQAKIFADRSSLIRFTEFLEQEADLCYEVEQKDYEAAYQLYMNIKEVAERVLMDPVFIKHDNSLPQHLRCFTAGAVLVRILTCGVEVLQFIKRYSDAVDQLRWLLKQSVYHVEYRGRWYDRLALNLDFHLKKPLEALETIKSALSDNWVRAGRRYSLLLRAKKICQASVFKKSKSTDALWSDFEHDIMNSVKDPIAVTITGRLIPHGIPGNAPMYITPESCLQADKDVTVLTRVEDVALLHYKDNGYPEGIHAEGSSVRSLFMLMMWDIVFMPGVMDVFCNSFQTFPLDLHNDNFYLSRRDVIERRLEEMFNSNNETLCEMAGQVWDEHHATLCAGMNWDLFRDRDHVLGLVKCIGGAAMAGIFRRLAELNRYVTGGFPDLTVWNPDSGKFKIVEVKGPGDRLSTKQILWLNYLSDLGIDAEVCYVKAISSRKM